jgi:membrane-bound ClpP family serine protease
MTSDSAGAALRSLQKILDDDVDFVCLYLDTPGGSLDASINLASFIVQSIDHSQVRVVAYIPYQARSDAAIVALACDEIVLGHDAVLGGDGATVFTEQQIADACRSIQDFLAKEAVRSWSLPVAFVDPEIEVFRFTQTKQGQQNELVDYFCEEEWKRLFDAERWQQGDVVKKKGKLLELKAEDKPPFFVDRYAKDFAEFKLLYGLENDPQLVEPSWADQLVQQLSGPEMSALFLLVFFIALVMEMQAPGIGVFSFIALVAIVLFFWLNFLGGTAGWLEVTLFVIGVLCVLLEVFVLPGFGIFGIGGAVAILASLVLASQTFIIPQNSYQFGQFQNSLLIVVIALVGMFSMGFAAVKILHRVNKPHDTALIQQNEKLADYDSLVGQTGTALTPLVPAGKALINGNFIDVVSDGNLLEKGVTVEVIEVVGYKIVVREV